MPGFFPHLDSEGLRRLRSLVAQLSAARVTPLPRERIVRLADELTPGGPGLTIDFSAAEQLGQPLIVLHAPQPAMAEAAAAAPAALERLSRRERQIAGLVAEGLANKQIAARLHISLSTVKDHVHRILRKIAVPNRAALAVLAVARGGPAARSGSGG